jgi:hypothetical protein
LSERERPKAASAKVRAHAARDCEDHAHAKLVPLRPVRDQDRKAYETTPIDVREAVRTLATGCRECHHDPHADCAGERQRTPEERDTYWAGCFSELEKD